MRHCRVAQLARGHGDRIPLLQIPVNELVSKDEDAFDGFVNLMRLIDR